MRKDIPGTGRMARVVIDEINNQATGARYLLAKLFGIADTSDPDIITKNDPVLEEMNADDEFGNQLMQQVYGKIPERTEGGWPAKMTEKDEQALLSILEKTRDLAEDIVKLGMRFNELENFAEANVPGFNPKELRNATSH